MEQPYQIEKRQSSSVALMIASMHDRADVLAAHKESGLNIDALTERQTQQIMVQTTAMSSLTIEDAKQLIAELQSGPWSKTSKTSMVSAVGTKVASSYGVAPSGYNNQQKVHALQNY